MLSVTASLHQGHPSFVGAGRQCAANSMYAMIISKKKSPGLWNTDDMNNILKFGDKIFQNLTLDSDHLLISDLPDKFEDYQMKVITSCSGTVDRDISEGPFWCMYDAISNMQDCCFMTLECYTKAIIFSDQKYYVYDPHSRADDGMPCPDGHAVLTCHATVKDLCVFLKKLSTNLFQEKQSPIFEVTYVTIEKTDDSSSEFEGFSEVSYGDHSDITKSVYFNGDVDSFVSDSCSDSSENIPLSFYKNMNVTCTSDEIVSESESDLCSTGSDYQPDSDSDLSSSESAYEPMKKKKKSRKRKQHNQDKTMTGRGDSGIVNGLNRIGRNNMSCSEHDRENVVSEKVRENACGDNFRENVDLNENLRVDHSTENEYSGLPGENFSSQQCTVNTGTCTQMSENIEHASMNGGSEKRGRKRTRNETNWKRTERKRCKDSGQSYVTERGKACRARKIGTGCGEKCRFKCKTNISESLRQEIFHSYWSLADITLQRQFLLKYVTARETDCKTTKQNSRRSRSFKWSLPNHDDIVQVCKTFFLHTLDISDQMIHTAFSKSNKFGLCSPEGRGKHANRPSRIPEDQKNFVRDHISSFPCVESHYCRKDSRRQYLSADLNLTKMYRLYVEKCSEKSFAPVKLCIYRNIFDTEFNLAFHKPIKDLCDLCSVYRQANAILKSQVASKYEQHIKDKEAARENKTNDKENAKYGEHDFVAACFDLEEVLVTPKSFESLLYYKRRLNTFNLTVYNLGTSDGYCYVWNETIAKRGSSDISSCILDFIKTMSKKGNTKFVFYSDNCGGQNKNRFYLSMLWYCLRKYNLTSVEHKYLEKGHTQNEGDSIHACIESASKNISVYTTGQWAAVIRTARSFRPYLVKEMSQRDFYDFQELSRYLKNFNLDTNRNKISFSEIKTFRMCAESPDTVFFRYHYNEQEQSLNLSQRLRHSELHDPRNIELCPLYSSLIKLSTEKYNDLISLCRKGVIPQVYHPHYLLLPHEYDVA